MLKLLKYELYKLFRNRLMLPVIPVFTALYVLIVTFRMPAFTGGAFRLHAILSNPAPAMWIGVVFAPLLISDGYRSRTFNLAVYAGVSRLKLVTAKMLVYYVIVALITVISVAFGMFTGASALPPFGLVLPRLLLCVLLNLGTASVPLLLLFCFRDVFAGMSVAAVLTYLLQQMLTHAPDYTLLDRVMRFYLPYRQASVDLWLLEGRSGIACAAALSAAYILLAFCGSYFVFAKMELK